MKILLACERSAGHVFPALCFGKKLRKESACRHSVRLEKTRSAKDLFLNGQTGKINEVYFFITSSFLKNYIKKEGFIVIGKHFPFRSLIIEGIWRPFEALYFLLKLRPERVIGFGGRDSFFLVLFSSFLFLDTVIYEPNIKLGKANRFLSFFVKKILRGFKEEGGDKKNKLVGIPLRENIKKMDKAAARKILNFNDKPVIFCFGGSQGSFFINNIFMKLIQDCAKDCQIIHLTGRKEYVEIFQLYNKMKNNKFIKDFCYEMEILYNAADIVISRAGAATLAEISFYKLPSILIPHPQGGGHQEANAFYFKEKGAALVCSQNNFSFEEFRNSVKKFIYNDNFRQVVRDNLSRIKLGISFEDFCRNTNWR